MPKLFIKSISIIILLLCNSNIIYGFRYQDSVIFSHEAGFYNDTFTLTISANDTLAELLYTTDGSSPLTSANIFTSQHSASILIHPDSTIGRGNTPAVIIKASVVKTESDTSFPVSKTYIFIEHVKKQNYPGGDWPLSNINDQIFDYNMDANVVYNDARYKDTITEALLDIPSISISTDYENLFDPDYGIYVNAEKKGREWERDCSAELLFPDGKKGFHVNAGLRIRGGWSRQGFNPKHSFRLFFREEYGASKLYYPLFEDEGVSVYDKIDLRTSQTPAWSLTYDNNTTFVREVFSRDAQREMGWPYTRSRYYHLYVNGMYWGLYQSQERSEARFAASYLGGDNDDYDVIMQNGATDGYFDTWEELWELSENGFASNKDYFRLEGKNQYGKPTRNSQIWVNIDNLIDYMIIIFYTGNYDSPASKYAFNKGAHNYYGIFDRTDKSKGFIFFAHDAEYSLMYDSLYVGDGINEDRVNIGELENDFRMEVYDISNFNPQWLHHKLKDNKEYRIRFADRVYKYLENNGLFTPDKAANQFMSRVDEIELAIIAESARWGDSKVEPSRTKHDDWLPEINEMLTYYFPQRTDIVINQFIQGKLYPTIDPPNVKKSGETIWAEHYNFEQGFEITLSKPNSVGTIYYTTDGNDPRSVGGGKSKNAMILENNQSISIENSTILKARILNGTYWSALKQIRFYNVNEDYSNLKVTELHYHPADYFSGIEVISDDDLEFIEFKNTGDHAINLTGLRLDSAVRYSFPDNAILPPKGFYVVASRPSKFYEVYGMVASGNYRGRFVNNGEYVQLLDGEGKELMAFEYSDTEPWYPITDGTGYSMVSSVYNPTGDPNNPEYWQVTQNVGGSPFADDTLIIIEHIEDRMISNAEYNVLIYPNPVTEVLKIHTNSIDKNVVSIYDLFGKQIYSNEFKEKISINRQNLTISNGIFIIKVRSGNKVSTQRLLFQ